jgi:hypothetical protein
MLRDLPNSRDLWVVLAQTPGDATTRFDVGGSTMGTQTGFRSFGFNGQNWVNLDGIVTNEGTAAAGFYMDYGAFQEIQVSAAANSAEVPVPGAFINTVIKTGSNELKGEVYFDWEDNSFQGNNVTTELQDRGISAGDKFVRYNDFNVQLGGPLKKDKLWWFYSQRDQFASLRTELQQNDGTPGGLFTTRLWNYTIKMNYQLNQANSIIFTGQAGRKVQPYREGQGTTAQFYNVDSTGYQKHWSWAYKGQWTSVINSRTTFDLSGNTYGYHSENAGVTLASAANANSTPITTRYTRDGRPASQITPAYIATLTPLTITGQTAPIEVNPNLKNQYTDEYTAGIDHQLLNDLGIHASWVRKLRYKWWDTIKQAEKFTDYAPVAAIDFGPDGVKGTPDDKPFTIFERTVAAAVSQYLTNWDAGDNYTTFEFGANKRFSNKWQMITGFDWTKRNLKGVVQYPEREHCGWDRRSHRHGSGCQRQHGPTFWPVRTNYQSADLPFGGSLHVLNASSRAPPEHVRKLKCKSLGVGRCTMPFSIRAAELSPIQQHRLRKAMFSTIGDLFGDWIVFVATDPLNNAWDVSVIGPDRFHWERRFSGADRDVEVISEAIRAGLVKAA